LGPLVKYRKRTGLTFTGIKGGVFRDVTATSLVELHVVISRMILTFILNVLRF
jgi:hypothetical protein